MDVVLYHGCFLKWAEEVSRCNSRREHVLCESACNVVLLVSLLIKGREVHSLLSINEHECCILNVCKRNLREDQRAKAERTGSCPTLFDSDLYLEPWK